MRLLVINWFDRSHPLWGGAEVYLHEVFRRLVARGHEVTLLCSTYRGGLAESEDQGIHILRRGHFWTFHLEVPWIYRHELAGQRWDCVFEYANKVPMLTPLFVRAPLVAVAHHLWGGSIFYESAPPVAAYVWTMERLLPAFYRHVPWIAVSESTRGDLVRVGIRAGQVQVVPNGVDAPSPPRPLSHKGGGGGSDGESVIAWIGRMKRYKRVDVLLRAMPRVLSQVPGVRLELAGDGVEAARLRALVERLGLGPEHVRFLGSVPDAERSDLFRRAAVLAQPSQKEGWGRTVLEAAAFGVPAVASAVAGLSESVRHGETGLLVPPGDPDALSAALVTLLLDPATRNRMGSAAQARARGFSWDAAAGATECLAHSLTGHQIPTQPILRAETSPAEA